MTPKPIRFIQLTDLHLKEMGGMNNEESGRFGTHGDDSPSALISETIRFMTNFASLVPLDFIILTGDSARHGTLYSMS
jgi:hypothetical protein